MRSFWIRNIYIKSRGIAVMTERDERVVESMFRSGMDKETVISLFPKFPKEEIEKIGYRLGKIKEPESGGSSISINCS